MKKIHTLLFTGAALAAILGGCKKETETTPTASLATETTPTASTLQAEPSGKVTEITVEAISPGSIELALPVDSNNQRVKFADLMDLRGNWEQTFAGERIRTLDRNAKFTVKLVTDKPEIPFLQTVDGAKVKITYDGQSREVSLKGDKYDWRPERLY